MTNQLDQISEAIGHLRGTVGALDRTFTQHCDDDDRRHRENLAVQQENNRQLGELRKVLEPLAVTVASMQPIVESYRTSKLKLTGAVGLALVILGFLAWLAEQLISSGLRWLFTQH